MAELDISTCKDVSEKGKTKQLISAYEVASENHDLDYFKEMLIAHEAAIQQDEDNKAAKIAEKEAQKAAKKADKKKRKSEVKVDEDVEMEDVDEAPKKTTKKRKKEPESDDEEPEKVS